MEPLSASPRPAPANPRVVTVGAMRRDRPRGGDKQVDRGGLVNRPGWPRLGWTRWLPPRLPGVRTPHGTIQGRPSSDAAAQEVGEQFRPAGDVESPVQIDDVFVYGGLAEPQ